MQSEGTKRIKQSALINALFEVSRTNGFRLEHLIAAINRAFEHFLADGMFRGDLCSNIGNNEVE